MGTRIPGLIYDDRAMRTTAEIFRELNFRAL